MTYNSKNLTNEDEKLHILVTGGAGYIGSHTLILLLQKGYEVSIIDNFSTGNPKTLKRVEQITNKTVRIFNTDIRDASSIKKVLVESNPEAIIHFAGLKSPSESFITPDEYYDVNVSGTINLLTAMDEISCKKIIFSSSATIYGAPHYSPCDEKHPIAPLSPYGRSKDFAEKIIQDWSQNSISAGIALRYFNPVGAHYSGELGEEIVDRPNNLLPYICAVALGKKPYLSIFGDDFKTHDGTGERDFIHVMDLARAHLQALKYATVNSGFEAFNIGTGNKISVLELVKVCEYFFKRKIKVKFTKRREGDQATVFADTAKAKELLGWKATHDIDDVCRDTWNWISKYPIGY